MHRSTMALMFLLAGCGARTGPEGIEDRGADEEPCAITPVRCPSGFADCDGAPATVCETDLGVSSDHCGACDNPCAPGLVCGGGSCRSPDEIVQVAATGDSTCALRASGEVLCWGRNDHGQLGDGTTASRGVPKAVTGLNDAVQLDGSGVWTGGTCARRASGQLACWGKGTSWQLGTTEDPTVPGAVGGITCGASVRMGCNHACVLLRDASIWCWGGNADGQLGDGAYASRLDAARVVALDGALEFDTGCTGNCAALATGEVACWGLDWQGWTGHYYLPTPAIVHDVTDAVSVWYPFPACAVHEGGTVSCIGYNSYGNIASAPAEFVFEHAVPIEGVVDARKLVGTKFSTCALRANGDVLCWGRNESGVRGSGSFDQPEEVTTTVVGVEGALDVTAGSTHACAALGARGVVCWGANDEGQLGDGTTQARAAPVAVVDLP